PIALSDRKPVAVNSRDYYGEQRAHRQRNGEVRLPRSCRSDAERDRRLPYRVDVSLLPARLRADRFASMNEGGIREHVARPLLAGLYHVDRFLQTFGC